VIDRSEDPAALSRQRWRLVFARDDSVRDVAHGDSVRRWGSALAAAGVPVAMGGGSPPRPRLAFASPLPSGMLGEHELVDLFLAERLTSPELRERLRTGMPDGHRLVDLHDVWLGEPAVAAQLVAADYRTAVEGASRLELAQACATLLAAHSIERVRPKGAGQPVVYDLRPLLLRLGVGMPVDPGATTEDAVPVRMRLGLAQEGAVGRPAEVVLALGELLGRQLRAGVVVRERVLTAAESA
jgi:radical SAM-linked protein